MKINLFLKCINKHKKRVFTLNHGCIINSVGEKIITLFFDI